MIDRNIESSSQNLNFELFGTERERDREREVLIYNTTIFIVVHR